MTREEEKALDCLRIMKIKPDHQILRAELKEQYLLLAKEYHPDTCIDAYKDGRMFSLMKNAYDYLYDHMELLNEAIHNILNPGNETHEYSYSWSFEEKPQEEVKEEAKPREDQRVYSEGEVMPNQMPKVKDRPTVFAAVLSILSPMIGFLMFFLTRRITPKSSWLYLILGILSLVVSYVILFVFMV